MPVKKTARKAPAARPFNNSPVTVRLLDTAYALQKAGSLQQAEVLYHQVLVAEPGNPFALYALGAICMARGENAKAVPLLKQALLNGYNKDNVLTHLGIALQTTGHAEEALELYAAARKVDPKNPKYPANVAVILAQKGDFEGALKAAKVAIKLDASFVNAYVNAGFFLQSLDRLPDAVEMFDKALALQPDNETVRDALKALHQVLASRPN